MIFKDEIVYKLIEKKYAGKKIDYNEFLKLYEPYKKYYSDITFAEILEISRTNYFHIKNDKTKAIILKGQKRELNQEEKEKIIEIVSHDGYSNIAVNYNEFQKLYKKIKKNMNLETIGLEEKTFAEILDISYSTYLNMKNKEKRATILKKELEEETIEKIQKELLRKGYRNKLIDYQEFKEIHSEYKNLVPKETDFAKILKISSSSNFSNMKTLGKNVRIFKHWDKEKEKKEKLEVSKSKDTPEVLNRKEKTNKKSMDMQSYKNREDEVKYLVENNAEVYSRETINKICEQTGVSLNKFLSIAFETSIEEYQKVLDKKGKLYVGKSKLSNKFVEKYGRYIIKQLKAKIKNKQYGQDVEDDTMDIILNRFSYIEKNIKTKDAIEKVLKSEIENEAKKVLIRKYYETIKNQSIDTEIKARNKTGKENIIKREIKDSSVNVSKYVSEKLQREENYIANTCIDKMYEYLEDGMDKKQVIDRVSKEMNLDTEQLLNIVNKELKRRVYMENEKDR